MKERVKYGILNKKSLTIIYNLWFPNPIQAVRHLEFVTGLTLYDIFFKPNLGYRVIAYGPSRAGW